MSDHFDPYHVWLGIPPEEQPPNHYRLLGLRLLESDSDVISNALDQRLAFLRTLQAGKRGALSQKLLNEVSTAGVVLLNREKKEQYDQSLRGPAIVPSAAPVPAAVRPIAKPLPQAAPLVVAPKPSEPGIELAPPSAWGSQPPVATMPAAPEPIARATTVTKAGAKGVASTRPLEPTNNPHLFPAIAAAVGLAGLIILGLGGWWLLNSLRTNTVDRPSVATNDQGGRRKGSDVLVGEDASAGKRGGKQTGNGTVERSQGKIETPVSVVTAADKQIWLADAPAQRVFRKIGNRWIDFRERTEDWYQPGPPGGGPVRLSDPARRISVELFDDRAEVSHFNSAPAVAHYGHWISVNDLPAFAKRPPASKEPNPLRWQGTSWHALVLDGDSSLSLPVPPEIAGPDADFTIEMWVRFDARFPESRLLLAGPLELHTTRPRLEIGGTPSMLMADLKSGPLGIAVRPPVLGDRWHHWAVVRAGRQLKLFIDGQSRAALPLEATFAIGAPSLLVGGRGPQQGPNLRGMIREVRISRGARYAQTFRPPLRLAKDDQTLLLPKFQADKGDTLEDLSGHGHHGSRGTAQWLPLTMDEGIVQAELPADYLDLKRTFAASIHTLRGTTENNPAYCDSTNVTGICQVLMPYQPTGDYDLDLEITRLEGKGGLLFGLALGPDGRQLALAIEAFPDKGGPFTGILPTDLAAVAPRACLVKHEPKLLVGKQQRVVVEVRNPASNRYSLRVTIDGAEVCKVSDFLGNLALPGALKMPLKSALFWGSTDAKIRYHSIKLLPAGKAVLPATVASAGNTSTGISGATNTASTANNSISAPSTATAAMAGKAWLADGGEQLAIRLTGGRWVELREKEHSWYVVRDASPSEFLLFDPLRNVDLRLRDNEVAFRTPSQDWASLGQGRWVDVAQLPTFAQRTPRPGPTSPASRTESPWQALSFDGRSALRMTLPPEITPERRDFTVEAWLRFDPWQPRNLIRLMNVGSLTMFLAPQPSPAPSETRELHLIVERTVHRIPLPVRPERWTHLALVRHANELRLYCDGKPVSTFGVSDRYALDGGGQKLVFGQTGAGSSSGFSGCLRDFRVSKVARYAAGFTPSLHLQSDDSTLILPKFSSDAQDTVPDLSPSRAKIDRDKAQWVALTTLGDLDGRRPDVAPPPSTVNQPPPIASPPPAVAKRRPVPAADELARRLAEARGIFEVQLKEAVKPAQKAALAKTILTAADNTKSDTDARYVLIDLARKVFIQAGEVNDSLAAAKLLEKEFDVIAFTLVIATIEALDANTLPPEERTVLAKTTIELAEELLDDEEYDEAEKLSTIASQSANKQKDAELRKDIVQRRSQIVRVTTAAKAALPSLELLKKKPDDAAANLAAGKFRCFVLEDWEAGLAHLAKSGDPLFATPAAFDQAALPGKSDALVAAGEAWLKLASDKAIGRDDRPAIQRRARQQLAAGLAGLVGLERVRVEKRLEELKDVATPAPRKTTRTRVPRAAVLPGLIGRVVARGQDAGIIVIYQPGYTVTQDDVQKLLAAAGATAGDSLRIDLLGVLTLTSDAQLEVRHAGGSSSGGVHNFFIGPQSISEVGDDRSKDDTRTLSLVKGQQPLRWTLTGGDLGTALLSLVPVDATGKPLAGVAAVQYSRDMNVLARSVPYRQEIKWGAE